MRSADKYNLAQRIGWLLADLQYGAFRGYSLFGGGFEGCADESQRSHLRCAVWDDRLHGCGQPSFLVFHGVGAFKSSYGARIK